MINTNSILQKVLPKYYKSIKTKVERLTAITLLIFLLNIYSCNNKKILKPITYANFENFVEKTGYVTDAEKYGWSIVQINVYDFSKVTNANWRKPDGINIPSSKELPVTQVSYNDAKAYCEWSGQRLPTYDEYWQLITNDKKTVVSDNKLPISNVNDVNVLGNVWDITSTEAKNAVRLAGGSLFCSKSTCHGTVKERELFVDKETANIHIGFCVVE